MVRPKSCMKYSDINRGTVVGARAVTMIIQISKESVLYIFKPFLKLLEHEILFPKSNPFSVLLGFLLPPLGGATGRRLREEERKQES